VRDRSPDLETHSRSSAAARRKAKKKSNGGISVKPALAVATTNSTPLHLNDRTVIPCPRCDSSVRADKLQKHLANTRHHEQFERTQPLHPKPSPSASRPAVRRPGIPSFTADAAAIPPSWYGLRVTARAVCPVCARAMQAFALPSHLSFTHRMQPLMEGLAKSRSTGHQAVNTRSSRDNGSPGEDAAREEVGGGDRRDSTRPYAHNYRENGRFGSHPLHDDYGDESDS
jgi:hypothetical protein